MHNSFRHSQARHVEPELRYDDRLLRIRIRPEGKGIESGVLAAGGREGHFGLHGMREGAKIRSPKKVPGKGTAIES
jgi:signal transduction histidine kinase